MLSQLGENFVELRNRINAFFKRLKRYGYVDRVMTTDDLVDNLNDVVNFLL